MGWDVCWWPPFRGLKGCWASSLLGGDPRTANSTRMLSEWRGVRPAFWPLLSNGIRSSKTPGTKADGARQGCSPVTTEAVGTPGVFVPPQREQAAPRTYGGSGSGDHRVSISGACGAAFQRVQEAVD